MAAPTRSQLEAYARQAAIKNGVDPNIFVRQIDQESGFDPTAHNASGADGIAQLIPQYYPNVDTSDPFASLDAAAQTMGANLQRNGGDYSKALAAYNAGQGNVDKYGGVPPFAETRTYISRILGSGGGGTTMATMQDGTDPTSTGVLSPQDFAKLIADHGGYVGVSQVNRTIPDPDPDLAAAGLTTTSPWPTLVYTLKDGKTLKVHFEPSAGAVQGSGNPEGGWNVETGSTALTVSKSNAPGVDTSVPNSKDPFVLQTDPKTGQTQWIPNQNYQAPLPPKVTSSAIGTGDRYIIQTDPATGAITKVPNPNYVEPKQVDPNQTAYTQALTAEAQARTVESQATAAKTQQGLRPVAQAAVQDAYATIAAIQSQMAAGTISPKEGDALMAEVHNGLSATLAGTTLFEQQKQAQDTQTQRANAASNFLQQRIQSAASLGASLFSSATGHVLLPKGQKTLGIDPFAIANQEVNTMGGGQATGDAASAFLKAALGGGNTADAGPALGPGAAAPSQFPTTREAVLAQYPHLAAPPTQADQFIPPNNEQNAGGGVTPLVTSPATPMPLQNGNIPTLLAAIGQGG